MNFTFYFLNINNVFFKIVFLILLSLHTSCGNKKGESKLNELNSVESLGQMLFMDPRLSVDGTISCNSCHNVMSSGTDNRSVSVGINGQKGGRNSPTVFNAKFLSVQFWDGRAMDLASQAKGPLVNPVEMGNENHEFVVERIKLIEDYKPYFKLAFGSDEITIDKIAQAIAKYEDTLVSINSPYDKFIAGDKSALSEDQVEGFNLFKNKGCIACHSGDHFAGPKMELGKGYYQKFPMFEDNVYVEKYNLKADFGRYEITKKEVDKHFFRVPTLRHVAETAPYFHNGAVLTLNEAIKVMGKSQLNIDINDIEANKIESFLKSLSGTIPSQQMPRLPQTPGMTIVDPK